MSDEIILERIVLDDSDATFVNETEKPIIFVSNYRFVVYSDDLKVSEVYSSRDRVDIYTNENNNERIK